jgi:hypothetical protein
MSLNPRHLILGKLLKGLANLHCFVLLVLLVATAKRLAAKAGISTVWPISLIWPASLVCLPALLACLPCWPACLVGPPALLAHLPCWPACFVLFLLLVLLLLKCFLPTNMP